MKCFKKLLSLTLALLFVLQLLPMQYLGMKTIEAFAAETNYVQNGYEFDIPKESDNTVDVEIPETFIDNRENKTPLEIDMINADGNVLNEEAVAEPYSTATDDINTTYFANPPYSYQNSVNEKVALGSGALVYENTDYVLPGRNGFDLVITRRYNSSEATLNKFARYYDGLDDRYYYSVRVNPKFNYNLGNGWSFGFTNIENLGTLKILHLSDGSSYILTETGTVTLKLNGESKSSVKVKKEPVTTPETSEKAEYTLTYNDGKTEYLSSDGKILYSMDKFGNRIRFSYSSSGNVTITDTFDR